MDIEKELVATLTQDDACLVYQQQGVHKCHFADERCAKAFEFGMGYFQSFGHLTTAPTVEVMDNEVPGFSTYISDVTGAAPAYLADKIKALYIKRQSEDTLRKALPMLAGSPQETASHLRDAFGVIVDNCSVADRCLTFGEGMDEYEYRLAQQREADGAPYPFREMQDWTGGIRPGEIAVLAAPTGKGKSMFACKAALEAVRAGWNVNYVTTELSIETVAERIALMQANIKDTRVLPESMRTADGMTPDTLRAMHGAREEVADMPGTLVIDMPSVEDRTPGAIIQNCKLHHCNYLIVDQLQFVTQPKSNSMSEALGGVMKDFKTQLLSPSDGVQLPMLMLHQINREGVKTQEGAPGKIGSMTNLSSSSWIEQLADVVWGMGCSQEEANVGLMNLGTLKSRAFAPIGWKLNWDLPDYRFDINRSGGVANRLQDW